jgi:hypothetical protein
VARRSSGLADGARPRLAHDDVSAAEPVGHVVDEAVDGQPASGPCGQPGEPAAKPLVTPADDGDIHVLDRPQDRGRTPVQSARALSAARHDDEELPA